ncbi:MAG: prolyl oligopeptidase family serine peptidase, partial [Phycisphaerales bacterium]|nr:prolyl oligopeptidase family serine peptidase [Phycisphaerales bacterium]
MMRRVLACASCVVMVALSCASVRGEDVVMREALAVSAAGGGGRSPVITDAIQSLRAKGAWESPVEGDVLALATGFRQVWKKIESDGNGQFEDGALYGGYAVWNFDSDAEKVMILDAAGHSTVWVNGEIRAGDLYEYGTIRIPVRIRKGANELMFLCGRGRLRATLREAAGPVFLDAGNVTMPHLLVEHASDDGGSKWGAVVVANATGEVARGLSISCHTEDMVGETTEIPALLPTSVFKAAFEIPAVRGDAGEPFKLILTLWRGDEKLDTQTVTTRFCTPDGPNNRTFRSRVDRSVQYYAERPASGEEEAVILTLHGASVEASGQAAVYAPKEWARIVAPTNRGKFGFDWEDWGRIDAMEVLDIVSGDRKAILTGHSMGGHGSWQVASHYPDRFVAVGPSAGWVSFASYAGYPNLRAYGGAGRILERAASPSDTLLMKRNFYNLPAFILHGSEDDNVPVEQAFIMRKELEGISPGLTLHSELGAGHWWGNQCCDWPEMMAFFKARLDEHTGAPDRVRFTTTNPGISARSEWVTIDQQVEALTASRVDLARNLDAGRIEGKTENVDRLMIDLSAFGGRAVTMVIDEDEVRADAGAGRVSLVLGRRGWDLDDGA